MSQTRLARVHWRIAEAIQRRADGVGAPLGEIAYHFAAGVDVGDAQTAMRSALAAGDDAMARVAFEDAASHYRTAVDLLARAPIKLEHHYRLLISLAHALDCSSAHGEAQPLWLEAAEIARRLGDHDRLFVALDGYRLVWRIMPDANTVRLLDELINMLPDGDSPLRAQAMGWRAEQRRPYDIAVGADAVAMARRTGDAEALASTLTTMLHGTLGRPDATAVLRTAQDAYLFRRQVPGRSIGPISRDLALALLRVGRRLDADEMIAECRRESTASRQGLAINNGLLLEAAVATAEGRFDDGKRLAAEANAHGGRNNPVIALAYAAQIMVTRMEQGRAHEVVTGLRQFDALLDDLPAWRAMLAGALADAGERAEARAELARLLPDDNNFRPANFTAPLALRYLPEVCRQLGDAAAAERLLPQVAAWSGQVLVVAIGVSIEGASDRSVGHLLATLGRLDEADEAYESAARLERDNGYPPLVARTSYWHSLALIERGRPEDLQRSQRLLADAMAISEKLGMNLLNHQARSLRKRLA
jgi:tetratricopeptide (TPR) repeat protein